MIISPGMHIVLLMGGFGSEREISIKSGENCIEALKENDLKVTKLDLNQSTITELISLKPDICFNCLHGKYGEDGNIQGVLNILQIPYTHSGVTASALAMNKLYFKNLISRITEDLEQPIYFPKTLEINDGEFLSVAKHNSPYVIKPVNEGSSVGVSLISNNNQGPTKKNWPLDTQLMAEPLVGTRELTVTILNDKPLCVTEIITPNNNDFYNYNAKYSDGGSLHNVPAKVSKTITKTTMDWALKAHQIIGCKGISRSDFRYDSDSEKLFMLEINTQPGMTKTSLAPEQALFCNINMPQMVKILLEEADYE